MGGMIMTAVDARNELSLFLFGICDILRGPINQDEYKSYIIPILFFKRISDVPTVFQNSPCVSRREMV